MHYGSGRLHGRGVRLFGLSASSQKSHFRKKKDVMTVDRRSGFLQSSMSVKHRPKGCRGACDGTVPLQFVEIWQIATCTQMLLDLHLD